MAQSDQAVVAEDGHSAGGPQEPASEAKPSVIDMEPDGGGQVHFALGLHTSFPLPCRSALCCRVPRHFWVAFLSFSFAPTLFFPSLGLTNLPNQAREAAAMLQD